MPNIEFSAADKIKIQVVEQEIAPDTFDDSQLPTDIHIVTYTYEGKNYSMLSALTPWLISLMLISTSLGIKVV